MGKKAFTMIELLAAIAIIAMIVVILVPALGAAREGARRAQCVNNLRQHGIAWYLYLDEHGGRFPPLLAPENGGVAIYYVFGGHKGNLGKYPAKDRILNKYLEIYDDSSPNLEIFHCPNDLMPNIVSNNNTSFDYRGNSYLYNMNLVDLMVEDIAVPKAKLFLERCFYLNTPGHNRETGTYPKRPLLMVLFVDGHVKGPYRHDDDFDSASTDPSKPVWENPNPD